MSSGGAAGGAEPAILAAAPRCGARTRAQGACRSPAVRGGRRCRMHGGKGSGAPGGNRNAWKHGARSARFQAIARYLRETRSGRLCMGMGMPPRLSVDVGGRPSGLGRAVGDGIGGGLGGGGRGGPRPTIAKFAEQPHAPGKRAARAVLREDGPDTRRIGQRKCSG